MDRLLAMLFGFLLCTMLAMPTIAWMTKQDVSTHPVYRLAQDLSGGDRKILDAVSGFIESPPAEKETVGFYSGDKYPEDARVYLSMVTLLANAGFIQTSTDKYISELFLRWVDEGQIRAETLSKPAREMLNVLANGPDWPDEPSESDLEKLALFLEERYADFVREVEAQFKENGTELISIDATGGDTLYFAIVEPAIASRWKGKVFSHIDDPCGRYFNGVRAPMWDRAWHALVYAYLLPVTKPTYTRPVPDGVRRRNDDLPWVK